LLIFALGIANIIAMSINPSKHSILAYMQEINEIGTVHDRISQMVDRFCKGNKTAFGRGANIQSGVLAGIIGGRRNKPSFEVLQKILTDVSPDWLLFGRGDMLRGASVTPSFSTEIEEDSAHKPFSTREDFESEFIYRLVEWQKAAVEAAQWRADHKVLQVLVEYVSQQPDADEFVTQIQHLLPTSFTPRAEEGAELARQL
jgi:hypothetical protein